MKLSKLQYDTMQKILLIYWRLNSAGGYLHVVLDDGNLEDEFINASLDDINKIENLPERKLYQDVAHQLLEMTMAYRRKTINVAWDILHLLPDHSRYTAKVLHNPEQEA